MFNLTNSITMKKTSKLILFFLLGCVFPFIACTETDDGKYVDPITLYEKVSENWSLTELLQIDETAKSSGIKPDEVSLIDQFEFATFSLQLNVDDDNQPTSYQVTGTAPELFPASGYWELNSPFPSASGEPPVLNLYSDSGKASLIGRLSLIAVPGVEKTMEMKLTRVTSGVAFVSYQYKLTKN